MVGERNDTPDIAESAGALADVARDLQKQDTPAETWQRIVDLAVQTMPHCEIAAISLVHRSGRVDTGVLTDPVAADVDAIQYQTGQGPCLDAIRDHDVFRTGNLAEESRWPDFAQRAERETGIASMLSFRLFVQEDTHGALNLYSRRVNTFTETDETMGALFAAHAALAMTSAQERLDKSNLEEALQSNRTIAIAIGLLMGQRNVDRDTAFRIVSGASQRSNVKLRDLAERIVAGHESNAAR